MGLLYECPKGESLQDEGLIFLNYKIKINSLQKPVIMVSNKRINTSNTTLVIQILILKSCCFVGYKNYYKQIVANVLAIFKSSNINNAFYK